MISRVRESEMVFCDSTSGYGGKSQKLDGLDGNKSVMVAIIESEGLAR